MVNLRAPGALFWLLAAPIFIAGCHSSGEQASVFRGDWKLTVPVLGQASVSFDNSQFTEKWSVSNDRDAGALVVSGPYQVSGNTLILNPKQFQIIGQSSSDLSTLEDNLKKADAWDYSVKWSGNDLAYLTATGSKDATVVMGLYRGVVKPNEKKLEFSFMWQDSRPVTNILPSAGQTVGAAPMHPSTSINAPAQLSSGQQERFYNEGDSSQSVTIITGTGNQDDGGQDQDAVGSQDSTPADSTKDNSNPGDGQVQRF